MLSKNKVWEVFILVSWSAVTLFILFSFLALDLPGWECCVIHHLWTKDLGNYFWPQSLILLPEYSLVFCFVLFLLLCNSETIRGRISKIWVSRVYKIMVSLPVVQKCMENHCKSHQFAEETNPGLFVLYFRFLNVFPLYFLLFSPRANLRDEKWNYLLALGQRFGSVGVVQRLWGQKLCWRHHLGKKKPGSQKHLCFQVTSLGVKRVMSTFIDFRTSSAIFSKSLLRWSHLISEWM